MKSFTMHVRRGSTLGRRLIVAGVVAISACDRANTGQTPANADVDAPQMARGLELLYQKADPVGAEAVFRNVLERNPTHYGAQFQLAVALDHGGLPVEARAQWESVLKNATAINDSTTTRTARTRLAAPDTASQSAMMTRGLDLLYRQNDAVAAVEQFRSLLRRNSAHYGATFQLAMAYEKTGQAALARTQWEKVLGMATTAKDEPTATTARARLAVKRQN